MARLGLVRGVARRGGGGGPLRGLAQLVSSQVRGVAEGVGEGEGGAASSRGGGPGAEDGPVVDRGVSEHVHGPAQPLASSEEWKEGPKRSQETTNFEGLGGGLGHGGDGVIPVEDGPVGPEEWFGGGFGVSRGRFGGRKELAQRDRFFRRTARWPGLPEVQCSCLSVIKLSVL